MELGIFLFYYCCNGNIVVIVCLSVYCFFVFRVICFKSFFFRYCIIVFGLLDDSCCWNFWIVVSGKLVNFVSFGVFICGNLVVVFNKWRMCFYWWFFWWLFWWIFFFSIFKVFIVFGFVVKVKFFKVFMNCVGECFIIVRVNVIIVFICFFFIFFKIVVMYCKINCGWCCNFMESIVFWK